MFEFISLLLSRLFLALSDYSWWSALRSSGSTLLQSLLASHILFMRFLKHELPLDSGALSKCENFCSCPEPFFESIGYLPS
jgi:hypothetical protein